jgi:flagellar protein FliS
MNQKIQKYQDMDTLGKSVPELIIKVYDGAIQNLNSALDFYRKEDFQKGYEASEKAKKFIVHLFTSLDNEKGGDIAKNLSKLYAFIVERINFIQATKDIASIEDSIAILSNVRDGWMQLAKNMKGKPISPNGTNSGNAQTKSMSISV